jgi:hypothetical protein
MVVIVPGVDIAMRQAMPELWEENGNSEQDAQQESWPTGSVVLKHPPR